jgi:hypothetical protein
MTIFRLTLLNHQFGALYPSIPVNQWLPAWEAARRRAEQLWFEVGPAVVQSRILPEEHFHFRGGKPRSTNWYPERSSDVTTHPVLSAL